MNLAFPYGFDPGGRTAQTDLAGHIRDMIEQILLTTPGERVNRPTFGCGTAQLVFAPNSDALAAVQQQVIQASLQQWLSDLIRVQGVDVSAEDATLLITVRYTIIQTQQQMTQQLVYGAAGIMIYFCTQKNRRALVLAHPTLNGIDYLEVGGDVGCGKTLLLTLLKDARQVSLTPGQVRLSGGSSSAQVQAIAVEPGTADAPKLLTVDLDQSGDFSTYTLTLVAGAATDDPPDGFDPQLSSVDFSFKAGCPTIGDCLPETCCPPEPRAQPDINYLAKDYDGFRQVMLDRIAVLASGWTETHAADLGITLVELLAYVADHLSYQQDAVGTEAYLGTARSRISLRRHAKLVDYRIDEGQNARVWVHFQVDRDEVDLPRRTPIFPRVPGLTASVVPGSSAERTLRNSSTIGFATMQRRVLRQEQNEMPFYTWSDSDCCLVPGATAAMLDGHFTTLEAGTVLMFEEVLGPLTGNAQDADPARRWTVRLTSVQSSDAHGRMLVDPLNGRPITCIAWAADDALPFPLCISSTTDLDHGSHAISGVSVARGNLIPADHGIRQPVGDDPLHDWEDLGPVPAAPAGPVVASSCGPCGTDQSPVSDPRPRYFPQLAKSPLTFARAFDPTGPASSFLQVPASAAAPRPEPQLCVQDDQKLDWTILDDLLSSNEFQRACVAEIERDGTVYLRFGDNQFGRAVEPGARFRARYRVGNGTAGNVGHDTLAHVLTTVKGITGVRNPMAAAGGVDPESMESIRQRAPFAFRTQLRAVTEDDYGTQAQRDPAIRQARGTLRWTGSWYTAFVSIDGAGGGGPTAALIQATKDRLNLLRMTGVDLEVEGAVIVGLRIELNVCVSPDHFRSDVGDAIVRLFTTGDLCDGRRGTLNPENFTFGQTIYTSPLIAAAQGVPGVSSATMAVFQRMDDPSSDGTARGYLTMGRLEIAGCDNDPDRLDHGIFVVHLDGGK